MSEKVLDPKLLAQIKGIQIRAKHLVNNAFAGEYKSVFRGRGMEFDEVREYAPGDDVRSIDWNVTARGQKPYVKLFKDERELTVLFVVDVSASSNFGSCEKLKRELLAEVTALMAYTALRNNDKAGLIVFSDHVEHFIPPKKGRGHVWRLIRDILTYQSKAKKTDLSEALDFLGRVIKNRCIVFLLSDFIDIGAKKELRAVAKRHDLVALRVLDPLEKEIPSVGYVEFEDLESGKKALVNTNSWHFQNEYKKRATKLIKEQEEFFRSCNIDFISLGTHENPMPSIIKFFRKREKRQW